VRREQDDAERERAGEDDADGRLLPDVGPAKENRHGDGADDAGGERAEENGQAGHDGDRRPRHERVGERLAGVGEPPQDHEDAEKAADQPHEPRLDEGPLHEVVVKGLEERFHRQCAW
jgi:hypothetical protein